MAPTETYPGGFFQAWVLTAARRWMREYSAVRNVIPDRQFCYAADEGGGWVSLEQRRQAIRRQSARADLT